MGKEVGSRIKEPNEVTYDLYDEFMLTASKDGKYVHPDIYPDKSLGITAVVVHLPATQHHDILFYRFAHMETPITRITHKGESMTMVAYEVGRGGSRFTISEREIQEKLKEMLEQIKVNPILRT